MGECSRLTHPRHSKWRKACNQNTDIWISFSVCDREEVNFVFIVPLSPPYGYVIWRHQTRHNFIDVRTWDRHSHCAFTRHSWRQTELTDTVPSHPKEKKKAKKKKKRKPDFGSTTLLLLGTAEHCRRKPTRYSFSSFPLNHGGPIFQHQNTGAERFRNVIWVLAREVIRDGPEDIVQYAADFFEKLLVIRSETDHDPAVQGAHVEDRFYNNYAFKVMGIRSSLWHNHAVRAWNCATGTCFSPVVHFALSAPLPKCRLSISGFGENTNRKHSVAVSFREAAPTLRNRLPNTLQHAEGIASFRRHLKLYLFSTHVSLSDLDMVLIGSPPHSPSCIPVLTVPWFFVVLLSVVFSPTSEPLT